jgi:hypothetical protein
MDACRMSSEFRWICAECLLTARATHSFALSVTGGDVRPHDHDQKIDERRATCRSIVCKDAPKHPDATIPMHEIL